ncbi:hypothetical protein GCM10010873_26560 [Cypionkella aquatica]|uniref:Uncharacterized protein n=1 Tax=Cypionkella aquatica TaxID=1756042 RepID=A0AA37TU96_9RHOB|nr:hypothetical protein [Cypionkella aquatica]GLS87682.1 hypothetical protein GCM10010873_26560 [Cypionkella aquatica]
MGARDDLLAIPDELLRNGDIAEAVLCWMDFTTGAKRWWAGFGDLQHAGHLWQGTGDVIGISDLTSDYQMSADPVTFSMAATTEMIELLLNARAAVRGRQVIVYSQLFAVVPQDGGQPWQPLASPMALFTGTMGPMSFSAEGTKSSMVSLQCEGLWARRNAPPRGLWTDRDQQARHPGDKGYERVALYTNYETRWI